jgi:hypothetical protein
MASKIHSLVHFHRNSTMQSPQAWQLGSLAAWQLCSLGGEKRAANMTPKRRKEIAQKAAAKR